MTLKFNSLPRKTLSQPITKSATSFSLNDILDWNKEDLTSASFGTEAYGVFHDAKNTVVEFFAFDPATIADGEIDFTYRGLAYNGTDLTTEVTANKREWSKGTYVELGTHAPQVYQWLQEYIDTSLGAGVSFATSAEIDTGESTIKAVNPKELHDSEYGLRHIIFRASSSLDLLTTGASVGGSFESPISGVIEEIGAYVDTAGITGTMVVDVNKNGTTLMTTDKISIDSTETSSRTAATAPTLTTTSLAVGDLLTVDIDSLHTGPAKGLVVRLGIRQ